MECEQESPRCFPACERSVLCGSILVATDPAFHVRYSSLALGIEYPGSAARHASSCIPGEHFIKEALDCFLWRAGMNLGRIVFFTCAALLSVCGSPPTLFAEIVLHVETEEICSDSANPISGFLDVFFEVSA